MTSTFWKEKIRIKDDKNLPSRVLFFCLFTMFCSLILFLVQFQFIFGQWIKKHNKQRKRSRTHYEEFEQEAAKNLSVNESSINSLKNYEMNKNFGIDTSRFWHAGLATS